MGNYFEFMDAAFPPMAFIGRFLILFVIAAITLAAIGLAVFLIIRITRSSNKK